MKELEAGKTRKCERMDEENEKERVKGWKIRRKGRVKGKQRIR